MGIQVLDRPDQDGERCWEEVPTMAEFSALLDEVRVLRERIDALEGR